MWPGAGAWEALKPRCAPADEFGPGPEGLADSFIFCASYMLNKGWGKVREKLKNIGHLYL